MLFKTHNQPFKLQSGGHDFECNSISTTAVISFALLNQVTPDFDQETITVGAGARWQDVYAHTWGTEWEVMGGMCPWVGVGGFLSGVGFNWKLSPIYGSGAGNVLSMRGVLADGSIVEMNPDNQYSDLMKGMLGAGGQNFAAATQFTLKLHNYSKKYYSLMRLYYIFEDNSDEANAKPLDEMPATLAAWAEFFDARRAGGDEGYGGQSIIIIRPDMNRRRFMIGI